MNQMLLDVGMVKYVSNLPGEEEKDNVLDVFHTLARLHMEERLVLSGV